jgi:hypothetical protein
VQGSFPLKRAPEKKGRGFFPRRRAEDDDDLFF